MKLLCPCTQHEATFGCRGTAAVINSPVPKLNKICSVSVELLHADRRIDRQTDMAIPLGAFLQLLIHDSLNIKTHKYILHSAVALKIEAVQSAEPLVLIKSLHAALHVSYQSMNLDRQFFIALLPQICRPIYIYIYIYMGRDSSVGIATRYGLDGPGIESRWGRDFPPWGPPNVLYNGYRVFPGGKAAGAWC